MTLSLDQGPTFGSRFPAGLLNPNVASTLLSKIACVCNHNIREQARLFPVFSTLSGGRSVVALLALPAGSRRALSSVAYTHKHSTSSSPQGSLYERLIFKGSRGDPKTWGREQPKNLHIRVKTSAGFYVAQFAREHPVPCTWLAQIGPQTLGLKRVCGDHAISAHAKRSLGRSFIHDTKNTRHTRAAKTGEAAKAGFMTAAFGLHLGRIWAPEVDGVGWVGGLSWG